MDHNFHDPLVSDDEDEDEDFDLRVLATAEADGEPVPSVNNLVVSGVPRPGELLLATAITSQTTCRCQFAWLRGFGSGSWSYLEGENKANYLVTADDVDCYLAVEAIPVGACDEMGEVVRTSVFEHQKISCGYEMQEEIEKAFFAGHASFAVSFLSQNNGWETSHLKFDTKNFSIAHLLRTYAHGNLLQIIEITILNGHSTRLTIQTEYNGYTLSVETSWLRDVIVLTMRAFLRRAIDKGKLKKKRFIFF